MTAMYGARATAQGAPVAMQRFSAITGTAYDSIGRAPLGGAQIQLAAAANASGRIFSAVADSLGRFRIDSVPFGDYLAGFFHPAIDSLGIEVPARPVRVAMDRQHINLGSPAPAQLITTLCGPQNPADSTALLIGDVRDATNNRGVIGATVLLEWTEIVFDRRRGARSVNRMATAHSRQGGWFALCGVPSGFEVTMRATAGADTTGFVTHESVAGRVDHMSFLIGHAARSLVLDTVSISPVRVDTMRLLRGGARAVGRVLNPQGAPIANARIDFVGTDRQATTSERGAFTVDSLPPGTRTVEARAIGYSPVASIVQLAAAEATTVELRLSSVQLLKPVEIRATTVFSRNAIQFQNHKRRAFSGSFVEPSAERGTDKLTLRGLLLTSAGRVDMRGGEPVIGVRTRAGGGYRKCYPTYYLDGRETFLSFDELELGLPPGTIMGVEIYANALGAPPEFGARPPSMPSLDPDRPTCGVIAIWRGTAKR